MNHDRDMVNSIPDPYFAIKKRDRRRDKNRQQARVIRYNMSGLIVLHNLASQLVHSSKCLTMY